MPDTLSPSDVVGTERLLCALVEDPDWCRDMFSHELENNLALLQGRKRVYS